jgi:hypothetical protein
LQRLLILGAVIGLVAVGFLLGGNALPVVLTGAFGLVTLLWQQSAQRESELEKQLASEKREHSKTYVGLLGEVAAASKAGRKVNTPDMVKRLQAWNWTAMLLASDEVIAAQARFIRLGGVDAPTGRSFTLPATGDVILALRREILPRTRLTPQQVLAVFVNEPLDDTLFTEWEAEKQRMNI